MRSDRILAITGLVPAALGTPGSTAADAVGLGRPGSPASVRNMKEKIKTVVITVMENRSFDNLLGGQKLFGLSNPIQDGPFCNHVNISRPREGQACTAALDYDSVMNDPDHSVSGNNLEFYGTWNPDNNEIHSGILKPQLDGFVTEQIRVYGDKTDDHTLEVQVMNYYTEQQVPVITSLTENFVVFNHWHSDIPGVRFSVNLVSNSQLANPCEA